mmetsp:Transcript_64193/g.73684  ORF Transcript_64193/g.73684 Transcript_64193/m.73684 type:complete len:833 (-) Transcript_64193:201-2699(-)
MSAAKLTRAVADKRATVEKQAYHLEQYRDDIHVSKEQMSRLQEKSTAIQNEIQQRKTQIRNLRNRELEEQKGVEHARTVDEEKDTKEGERAEIISERVEKLIKENIQDNSMIMQEYGMANVGNALITKIPITSVKIRHVLESTDGVPNIKHAHVEKFRVNTKTSFIDLRLQACKFWGVDPGDYLLCDENYHNLSTVEEAVELFFNLDEDLRSMPRQNVLNLIEVQTAKKSLNITQRQDVAYGLNMNKRMLLKFSKQKRVRDESGIDQEGISRKVLMNYPGLKEWMSKDRKIGHDHLKSWDTHICTLVFLILILGMSLATMYNRRELPSTFHTTQSLSLQLSDATSTAAGKDFYKIQTLDDARGFLKENPKFFLSGGPGGDNYTFYTYPIIRIRQLRSKGIDCPNSNILAARGECYESIYSSSTRETGKLTPSQNNITEENQKWWLYRTEGETQMANSFVGRYSSYDGSGYVWMAYNRTATEYDSDISKLFEDPIFFSESVRAVVLDLAVQSPSLDQWIYLAAMIELSVTGYINPTFTMARMFKSDSVSGSSSRLFVMDIFVILLSSYMFFLMATSVWGKWNDARAEHREIKWYELLSINNFIDLLVWIFYVCQVAFLSKLDVASEDICTSAEATSFGYDFFANANNWQTAFEFQAAACGMVLLRLILVLRLNRKLHLLIVTVKYAMEFIVHFFLVILAVFFVFAAVAMNTWGALMIRFSKFSFSLINIFGYIVGSSSADEILDQHRGFSFFILVALSYTGLFFLRAVFISCFLESWRKMVLENGYPENYENETKWQYWDALRWMFAFLGRERVSKWFKGGSSGEEGSAEQGS